MGNPGDICWARWTDTEFVLSHSIVHDVACDRCHFEENPFELVVLTADGEVPEPPAEETTG